MAYKQKLTKIGNSVGIIIPKKIRNKLNLNVDSEVYLEPRETDESIVLTKRAPKTKLDPNFFKIVKEVDKKYSQALEELANK